MNFVTSQIVGKHFNDLKQMFQGEEGLEKETIRNFGVQWPTLLIMTMAKMTETMALDVIPVKEFL